MQQRGAANTFLADLAEEEPDAAALFAEKAEALQRQPNEEWPAWSGHIQQAFHDLRDDRHVGDMGGLGRIYFSAIDRYAQRYSITGEAFESFKMFLRALDEEFLRHIAEKRKADAEKRKNQ